MRNSRQLQVTPTPPRTIHRNGGACGAALVIASPNAGGMSEQKKLAAPRRAIEHGKRELIEPTAFHEVRFTNGSEGLQSTFLDLICGSKQSGNVDLPALPPFKKSARNARPFSDRYGETSRSSKIKKCDRFRGSENEFPYEPSEVVCRQLPSCVGERRIERASAFHLLRAGKDLGRTNISIVGRGSKKCRRSNRRYSNRRSFLIRSVAT